MAKYIKDKNLAGQFRSELSHLCHTYVSSFRPSIKDLKQLRILKNLRNNKNIFILKPDKGNGIVIMNREDYEKEIFKIIQDPKKFKLVDKDPTLQREAKLQHTLRKYKKEWSPK